MGTTIRSNNSFTGASPSWVRVWVYDIPMNHTTRDPEIISRCSGKDSSHARIEEEVSGVVA